MYIYIYVLNIINIISTISFHRDNSTQRGMQGWTRVWKNPPLSFQGDSDINLKAKFLMHRLFFFVFHLSRKNCPFRLSSTEYEIVAHICSRGTADEGNILLERVGRRFRYPAELWTTKVSACFKSIVQMWFRQQPARPLLISRRRWGQPKQRSRMTLTRAGWWQLLNEKHSEVTLCYIGLKMSESPGNETTETQKAEIMIMMMFGSSTTLYQSETFAPLKHSTAQCLDVLQAVCLFNIDFPPISFKW